MMKQWVGIGIIGLWLIIGLITKDSDTRQRAIVGELAGIGILLF